MAKNKEQMKQEIQAVLTELGCALETHGGGVELVDVDETSGKVFVRLMGACAGCPMSDQTLKQCIEAELIERMPDIRQVIAV